MTMKREKKRILEIAGLDAKAILRESNEVYFQFEFDDEESAMEVIADLKKLGAINPTYVTSAPRRGKGGKQYGDFIKITIRGGNKKLLKWAADQYYGGDIEDAKDEFPELT